VVQYIRASLVASLVAIVALTFVYRFKDFSKGLFIIDWIFTTGLLLGVRGSFRMFLETQKRRTLTGDKVLIYGAGRGGELLLREILHNKSLNVKPIGFIDDDALKQGKKIQGFQILGTFQDLGSIRRKHGIDAVLISFNGLGGSNKNAFREVKAYCRQKRLGLKQFKVGLQEIDLNQDEE
jgi:UDP-GlcNAc:undecaprenyl-phosphate GlcNAc-1-phosphate transferase